MKGLLCRALLFTLILNSPYLFEYFSTHGLSPWILSDWDEPLYLPQAFAGSAIPFSSLVTFYGNTLEAYHFLGTSLPHAVLDVIVGHCASFLNATPVEFALTLDLAMVFLVYLILARAFQAISPIRYGGDFAALVTLALPWLASFSEYTQLRLPPFPNITTASHNFYPCQPILRAVYTQVSWLPFAVVFSLLISFLKERTMPLSRLVLLGALSGGLIYCYFFAWGAALALICTTTLIHFLIVGRAHDAALPFKNTAVFFSSHALVAGPGILALFSTGKLVTPGPESAHGSTDLLLHYSNYWYFSPLALVAALGYVMYTNRLLKIDRSENKPSYEYLLGVIPLAAVLSEFALMNLQPLANRWLTPYHFCLFFLDPIISGCVSLIAFSAFRTAAVRRTLAGSILLLSLVTVGVRFYQTEHVQDKQDYLELFRFVRGHTDPLSSIVVNPFDNAFAENNSEPAYLILPYWLETFTQRKTTPQLMGFLSDREPVVRSEIAAGWMFSGVPRMIAPCLDSSSAVPTDDILTGAGAFHHALRVIDCRTSVKLLNNLSLCDVVHSVSSQYILWEPRLLGKKPEWYSQATHSLWVSTHGDFEVLRFDSVAAEKTFCEKTTEAR